MGDEVIPFLGGKVRVTGSESGAKMIFECADCTFGGVVVLGVRGDKLEVNVVFAEVFLHCVGALIVQDVESGGCTMQKTFCKYNIDFQLVPLYTHHHNDDERAIRTFKNHLCAGITSCDPNFPSQKWDRLIP